MTSEQARVIVDDAFAEYEAKRPVREAQAQRIREAASFSQHYEETLREEYAEKLEPGVFDEVYKSVKDDGGDVIDLKLRLKEAGSKLSDRQIIEKYADGDPSITRIEAAAAQKRYLARPENQGTFGAPSVIDAVRGR